MCDCNYDRPDVYDHRQRTARKAHVCEECNRIIQPGERYEYVFGVWGDLVSSFYTCRQCLTAMRQIKSVYAAVYNEHCVCFSHGAFWDDFLDMARSVAGASNRQPGVAFGLLRLYLYRRTRWTDPRAAPLIARLTVALDAEDKEAEDRYLQKAEAEREARAQIMAERAEEERYLQRAQSQA